MPDIKLIGTKAKKVIELWKTMDKAFSNTHSEEHLKVAIMAGLQDAKNQAWEECKKFYNIKI